MGSSKSTRATRSARSKGNRKKSEDENTYLWNDLEYPVHSYVPPKGTLRVHSAEPSHTRWAGRVLQKWSLCVKPRTEPSGGCRMGHFGYFVRNDGVLRRAIWVGKREGVCDWVPADDHAVAEDTISADDIEDIEQAEQAEQEEEAEEAEEAEETMEAETTNVAKVTEYEDREEDWEDIPDNEVDEEDWNDVVNGGYMMIEQ